MEYIAQTNSDSLRTRCAKSDESHKISYKNTTPTKRMPPPKIKLHDTHTQDWMSPPIIKTENNRYIIQRKP